MFSTWMEIASRSDWLHARRIDPEIVKTIREIEIRVFGQCMDSSDEITEFGLRTYFLPITVGPRDTCAHQRSHQRKCWTTHRRDVSSVRCSHEQRKAKN